jgi:hypothetical protein
MGLPARRSLTNSNRLGQALHEAHGAFSLYIRLYLFGDTAGQVMKMH